MRKLLHPILRYFYSYPVLVLLLIAVAAVLYSGAAYKPIERTLNEQNAEVFRLRKMLKELEGELVSLDREDLRKRYTIFQEFFLTTEQASVHELMLTLSPAFEAYGWALSDLEVEALETVQLVESSMESPSALRAVQVSCVAYSRDEPEQDDEPFLPFLSVSQLLDVLWVRAPYMEFSKVDITRQEVGYTCAIEMFMPLAEETPVSNNDL